MIHRSSFTACLLALFTACSSSSSTTPASTTPDATADSGRKAKDAEADTESCIPLGSECTEDTALDCCLKLDGPAVTCGMRNNTGKMACRSETGDPCTNDNDCVFGACGADGTCAPVEVGGTCGVALADPCIEKTDAGENVVCVAGVCKTASSIDTGDSGADGALDSGTD
jgi:hypothetical protein